MALSYTRLFCRRGVQFKGILQSSPLRSPPIVNRCVTAQACESHDAKNKRLNRPLSPHLTIYKPQLTSLLSVTHRGTGIALAYYATAAGIVSLFVPGGMNCLIESIIAMNLSSPTVFLMKFAIAWPATYHYFNGIRHLSWDLGKFLSIKQVYTTGWTVVGLSLISALVLCMY